MTWTQVPLTDLLTQRQETPESAATETGEMRIVAKIGFDTGRIEFRTDNRTRTKMITVRPGDIVVSGINAAKGAIAVYGEEEQESAAATIHYAAYKVRDDRADRSFLWWLLRSNTFRRILAQYVPGGIKTELKAKRLLPIPVPLPPLSEQQRIVAKIERVAGKMGEAHGLREDSVRMTEALLRAKLKELNRRLSGLGCLAEVLADKPRNGWSPRCDNAEDGTPVLTLSAVTGYGYAATEYKRTSLPTDPEAQYWLSPGDLLITRSNTPELVGHAAIYDGTPHPCIYPDLTMRVPVDEHAADKRFVWYWLQSPLVREYIRANAKGTSPTMKKISQGTVMNIPFPSSLPLQEQRRIVDYLGALQAKVDRVKELQAKMAAELDALLPSILDKAFKGELTSRIRRTFRKGIFFRRGAIASYIVQRLHDKKTFGRVQFEKALFLAETHVGIDLGGQYKRDAAGPYDSDFLYKLEYLAAKNKWFTKHERGAEGFFYRPGDAIHGRLKAAERILGRRRNEMDRLLEQIGRMDTEQAEIVATLFAAWNDFLIQGGSPGDDKIICEVRQNWHGCKRRFTEKRLRTALGWMREKALVPRGLGVMTTIRET